MTSSSNGWHGAFASSRRESDDETSSSDSLDTIPPAPKARPPPWLANDTQPSANEYSSDDDLGVVTSDLAQPAQQQLNAATPTAQASAPSPAGGKHPVSSTGKRSMSEAQRKLISQALKARWAAGRMDHVHEKIKENKKRKSLLRELDDFNSEPPSKRTAVASASTSTRSAPGFASLRHLPTSDLSGYSRPQLELWAYIRPHLHNFRDKPIPTRFWVPELLALPRARDFKLNPYRKRSFNDSDDKKVAALLLYLNGEIAPQACLRCISGNGVFGDCVKLSPDASKGLNIKNCANCWYSHQACTYEAEQFSNSGDPSPEQETYLSGIDDESAMLVTAGGGEEDPDRVEEPQAPQQDQKVRYLDFKSMPPILRTLKGRKYSEWPDGSGTNKFRPLKGSLLLPDEYVLDVRSGRQWWCPVDECQHRLFVSETSLNYHFSRRHYAQVLEDNLDGTFSIIGLYDEQKLGNGGAYPVDPPSFPYIGSRKAPTTNGHARTGGARQSRLTPSYDPSRALEPGVQDDNLSDGPSEDLAFTWQQRQGGLSNIQRASNEAKPRDSSMDSLALDTAAEAVASLQTNGGTYGFQPQSRVPADNRHGTELRKTRQLPPSEVASPAQRWPTEPKPLLEMQDWEIAPGRVRYENSETVDDLALSKNFLLSGPVNIHDDIQVQVEVISAAKPRRFEPVDGKLRCCTVGSGQVLVRVDGQPEVIIGPQGLFKIRPGDMVSVHNRMYSDAVLTVITYRLYD